VLAAVLATVAVRAFASMLASVSGSPPERSVAVPADLTVSRPPDLAVPDRAVAAAVSPVCGRWPQLRRVSAWAAARAADRRMARSAHHEQVPEARLPIAMPTTVPAVPIMLPRTAASTVPVAAAAMAGRCERKVSGLADKDFSGVAVSRIMLSRRVMARRPYGFQTGSRYPIPGHRGRVITKAGERRNRAVPGLPGPQLAVSRIRSARHRGHP